MTNSIALPKMPLTFIELAPATGSRVHVETRMPANRYVSRLLGYAEGNSIIIQAPVTKDLINEGTRVIIKLASGNFICTFDARILKIQSAPLGYWHLEYPDSINVQQIRRGVRVPVNLKVSMDVFEEETQQQHLNWPITAYCKDISLKGACVNTSVLLGRQGDKLFMNTRFQVADIDQMILLPVCIRSIKVSEGKLKKIISHNLEFIDIDEETRLILIAFVYQQALIENGLQDIVIP